MFNFIIFKIKVTLWKEIEDDSKNVVQQNTKVTNSGNKIQRSSTSSKNPNTKSLRSGDAIADRIISATRSTK